MPGSMGTPGLETERAGFVPHPEKGWLSVWKDAWASDSSANTASIANVWVHISVAACDRFLLLCNGKPQLTRAEAAKKMT